jgi:N-acetylglucosaminyldiphosphoundecaprenol N-acetyl-beta-D-mannosaminyltransferase
MQKNNIINILGINISTLSKKEVLKKIKQFLTDGGRHQIVTPNPEFILKARQDEEFFYILNNADLAVPDGVGLKFAAWLLGKNIKRITGADLVKDILKIAQEKKLKVAVLNWGRGLSNREEIKSAVKKNYPKLQFSVKDIDRNFQFSIYNFQLITHFRPDILFCTFGAPYQEKFIYHNLKNLPSVKLAIGVGGAFDFLTGKIKRAPRLMRALGLEWFWRLILEPRYRFKRIYNAVIVFPLAFIKWKFILPFFYRPNVACMLYKMENNKYKILLVERREEKNHWQLPQGGTDGEDIKAAGEREIKEELGTDKFKIIQTYKNLWKYKFDSSSGKYNEKVKRIVGYKGQKQSLAIAEFLGRDGDIKVNFWDHSGWKWVDAENLINEVHPVRREAVKIFLEKFNNLRITN